MSETAATAVKETTEVKGAKTEGKVEGKKAAAQHTKAKKLAWTIERCKKIARRFHSEEEWKFGAPSSWKSATAHGWIQECVAQYGLHDATKSVTPKKAKAKAKTKAKAHARKVASKRTTTKTAAKKKTKKAA